MACKGGLRISPVAGAAVLFYGRHPDGTRDDASTHAACLLLEDQDRWALSTWMHISCGDKGERKTGCVPRGTVAKTLEQ